MWCASNACCSRAIMCKSLCISIVLDGYILMQKMWASLGLLHQPAYFQSRLAGVYSVAEQSQSRTPSRDSPGEEYFPALCPDGRRDSRACNARPGGSGGEYRGPPAAAFLIIPMEKDKIHTHNVQNFTIATDEILPQGWNEKRTEENRPVRMPSHEVE